MSAPREATLRERSWDSEHFGIRVGELSIGSASGEAVHAELDRGAREFDLIYLRDANAEVVTDELLADYCGQHTDTRATFELAPLATVERPAATGEIRSGSAKDMSDEIADLAFQAAERSRFRNDDRFPEQWVRVMYRHWVDGALARDSADEVLLFERDGKIIGLYTLSVAGDTANLDLFAVDRGVRGQGIGGALMVAAIDWMRDHSLVRATVTTQLDNPACRLYREMGYALVRREEIYHLWPGAESGR